MVYIICLLPGEVLKWKTRLRAGLFIKAESIIGQVNTGIKAVRFHLRGQSPSIDKHLLLPSAIFLFFYF
jgi:hypothetical protein